MKKSETRILVTGGMGFIGSEIIRLLLSKTNAHVANVDKLTYASNPEGLHFINEYPKLLSRYQFFRENICNQSEIEAVLKDFKPTAVIHTAAESHVDRSINGPAAFMTTNMMGTYSLLEACRKYFTTNLALQSVFRFLHVSTDEVYGSVNPKKPATEHCAFQPNSPYSASKAASDHLVRAWNVTYQLPTLITHCSNNYGYYQFPEKLIPLCLIKALHEQPIPILAMDLICESGFMLQITQTPF